MKTYSTSIEINTAPDRVWSVLIDDLQRDPGPFGIIRIDGTIALNSRIKLRSEVDPKRDFALTVTAFDAPSKMVWQGGMPLGVFRGTRTFQLNEMDGRTLFHMDEVFTGALAG